MLKHHGPDPGGLPALDADEARAAGLDTAGHASAWGGVATSVARFAATALNLPGGSSSVDAAVDVLHALSGVQDAQTAMLESLAQEVQLLRAAPYKTALLLVGEAARVGPSGDGYEKFLGDASTQLYEAHSLCDSVEEQAVVEFHLGLVYMLLDKPSDAVYWLLESCKSGHKVLDDLAARAGDVTVVKHKSVAALTTLSSVVLWPVTLPIGAALLAKKHEKRVASKAASATVEQFVPFVNTAADCYNSLGPATRAARIVVSRDRHGHLVLEEAGGDPPPG